MDVPRSSKRRSWTPFFVAGGVCLAVAGGVGMRALRAAPPTLTGAGVFMDTVRRGDMVRDVRGAGTLTPEQSRIVTALTAGRIERILVRPGATVGPATVICELSNPDVQLQALDAERQLSAAETDALTADETLGGERLSHQSELAAAESEYHAAARTDSAIQSLAARGFATRLDAAQARDKATALAAHVQAERARLAELTAATSRQGRLRAAEAGRLRDIVQFHRERIDRMRVVAGDSGVVNELNAELGQWVLPGTVLARVAAPGHLKAVLHINETDARDVSIGQHASIDTHDGIVPGHVARVDPSSNNGMVTVEIALDAPPPRGARPDLNVEGTIETDRLRNVLSVARPADAVDGATIAVFRVDPDGSAADRVPVRIGRTSATRAELLQGLKAGDRIIVSDMSQWVGFDRIRLQH